MMGTAKSGKARYNMIHKQLDVSCFIYFLMSLRLRNRAASFHSQQRLFRGETLSLTPKNAAKVLQRRDVRAGKQVVSDRILSS